MVKLLRITSTEDCIFEADLDAGIALGENASIGLQNLTFESIDFTSFSINSNNNDVSFSLNRLDGDYDVFEFLSRDLTIKSYTSATLIEFWKDLEATLNECLKMDFLGDTGTAYASFRVLYPNPELNIEKVVIVFKLTPMQMMFNFNSTGAARAGRFALMAVSRMGGIATGDLEIDKSPNSSGNNLGNTNMAATLGAVANRQHYVYPREGSFGFQNNFEMIEWSRGSGMYMVRIQTLVDNLGNANTNGFSIGFSTFNLQETTSEGTQQIDDDEVFFEIRVKRPQDFYEFITPDSAVGVPTISSTQPFSVSAGQQNDHMIFQREGRVIKGSIFNTSAVGGVQVPLFTYTLTREQMKQDYLPFFCLFGEKGKATLGHPNITFNPIINPLGVDGSFYNNDTYTITGLEQGILESPGGGGPGSGDNCFAHMAAAASPGFANIVPQPDDSWFDKANPLVANTVLKLNGGILRLMGFDDTTYPNNTEYILQSPLTDLNFLSETEYLQFNIIPDGLIDLTNSDNYIVMLDSNPLFSYDASKYDYTDDTNISLNVSNTKRGRRINILATIPVNNNNGTVEYRANDPIYIDLDNKFPQVIKNLRLRVLNKNFDKVQTTGESVMTLLLNDK